MSLRLAHIVQIMNRMVWSDLSSSLCPCYDDQRMWESFHYHLCRDTQTRMRLHRWAWPKVSLRWQDLRLNKIQTQRMTTANASVATVLGSIPASVGKVESEGRQMKQCWIVYEQKEKKIPPKKIKKKKKNKKKNKRTVTPGSQWEPSECGLAKPFLISANYTWALHNQ